MSVRKEIRRITAAATRRLRHRRLSRLTTLARLAAETDGTLAVEARHLETGRALSLHADAPCKMVSVVKVPLAVHVLACIDEGRFGADDLIPVEPRHLCPASGVIEARFRVPGVVLSVENLLRLAIIESDNSATDVLFDLVGGPAAVQGAMQARGFAEMSIDRTIREMISAYFGYAVRPGEDRAERQRKARQQSPEALRAFFADGLDTTTPQAMVDLLASLWRGTALPPARAAYLLSIMSECTTGNRRIRALVPAGAVLAQKTGSLRGKLDLVADVGILRLPGDAGHIALAAFLTGSRRPWADQEGVIAQAARIAYDTLGKQAAP